MSGADTEIALRLLLAGVLGYGVGLEREYVAHRDAGSSTFALIALASALVTSIALNVFGSDAGSRLVGNIMVGIGFLGGGTIIKDARQIRGLTTAAGIWAMASVGILVGTGRYGLAVAATGMVLVLFGAEHLERRLGLKRVPDEPKSEGAASSRSGREIREKGPPSRVS
jgi:putative Mg2+ transporter-C (MgtC) family protein